MSLAPNFTSRRFTALSLASIYSTTSILSSAFLLWIVQTNFLIPRAYGQTSIDVEPAPLERDERTDAQRLLEEARQRLLERGEMPGSTPALTPSSDPASTSVQSDPYFELYRLGPGDSIFVNVRRPDNLSFQATLDLQGDIIVPIVGGLSLEGLTLQEAQQRIQAALNQFVVNPEVSLTLTAQRPVTVTILGEVVRPGLYPLPAPQISVALVSAGGATGLADLRAVQIQRSIDGGPETQLVRNVDLYTPLDEAGSIPDLRLSDGDVIVVPTLTARALEDYDRSLVARSTLAKPTINVRVLNYTGGIGNLNLPNGSNFLDALTAISPDIGSADLNDIALIRFDLEQGRAVTQEIDGRDALRGDPSQNVSLQDNDVIVIGRNLIARITYALNTFTQPFRDVLGFILFFDALGDGASDLFGPNDDDDD